MESSTPRLNEDARLAAMAAGIGEVYYVLDRDWRVVLLNSEAETSYFERPAAEVLGRSLWDLFPGAEERSPFTRLLRQAMERGVAGRLTRPSQNWPGHHQEYRVAPLDDEGIGVCVVDVTERVLAEAELRANRERLDLAVGAHRIGIFDWQLQTDRMMWSRELEEIFGLEPGSFEGGADDFRRRTEPDDRDSHTTLLRRAIAERRDIFEFEFRIRHADGSRRWLEGVGRIVYGADGRAERLVGTTIDVTQRKTAEAHQRLLVNELNHRVKNTLAIVQAMAWQSLRAGGVSRPAREDFEGRLAALAAAHDVLTQRGWESGTIADMVSGALAPHDPGDGRVSFSGPEVELEPKTAVALALAVHELATNAVKYGALATSSGRVDLRWSVEAGRLRMTWVESGGPEVTAPAQKGFGARLLEQGLGEELGGVVRLEFRPEGVVCEVDAELAS